MSVAEKIPLEEFPALPEKPGVRLEWRDGEVLRCPHVPLEGFAAAGIALPLEDVFSILEA